MQDTKIHKPPRMYGQSILDLTGVGGENINSQGWERGVDLGGVKGGCI